MKSSFNNREHIRQLSIIPYVVMLALLVPLTVFVTQKEQEVRTRASANFTATSGRPFADTSAWNQPIGSNVELDPNSAAMVAKLSSGQQGAALYDFGTPIFFADSSTPKYQIDCTMPWGACGLEGEQVPIPAGAQPAPGSDGQMVIVDLSAKKSYEFWQYKNDKATTSWGGILPIDGDGRGTPQNHAVGAGTSRLAGVVRTYEIEQGVIDHALVFATKYCKTGENRPPATKDDGKYTGEGAIPEGARVQLDPTVNVDAIAGITKAEKAVGKALQKYGGYVIDCAASEMAVSFENPIGKADPYPAAGFSNDYFEMDKIPWNQLRVLKAWNSYNGTPAGITPTFGYIAPCPSCSSPTISPVISPFVSSTIAPTQNVIIPTISQTEPVPTTDPCESTATVAGSNHRQHDGGLSGFMDLLLQLLNLLLRLLSGGTIPTPTPMPTPDPTVSPNPEPCSP
jgi:hypothetical protein